jgi:hypothetical protein
MQNLAFIKARTGRHATAFLVIVFLLECALWMRAFWPWDSDPFQVAITLPLGVMLTAFSFEEFAVLLLLCVSFFARAGRRVLGTTELSVGNELGQEPTSIDNRGPVRAEKRQKWNSARADKSV